MGHLFAAVLAVFGLNDAPVPPQPVAAPETFTVAETTVADEKSVFATIESANVVPARVRTGGTIIELKVRQGDRVEQGQVIATVGDQKLALSMSAYAAQIQAAQAQLDQARLEFERAQKLMPSGAIARNAYDQAQTNLNVASSNLKSITAQRAVVQEQEAQGRVLAPASGRVITVPVTAGTVVLSGDIVATVAEQNFVLRLQVPERHARYLKDGDPVRLEGSDIGLEGPRFGSITLIYPDVQNGHVVADAQVAGLRDYFVGQRVRVWIPAGDRKTIVVPANLIATRFGMDYARLWLPEGAIDVPVQRGQTVSRPGLPDGLEILSGLKAGDRLLPP
jgi:RND family efflux transporter MFP subunit